MELNWGVHDVLSIDTYKENLLGSRLVIPRLLQLFTKYDIHATWAIVGMLYCKDKEELLTKLEPLKIPYTDQAFSPHHILDKVGRDEWEDPYHYASSLIEQIRTTPNQEIGTHTFTHYYCLEDGQDINYFTKDLETAKEVEPEVSSLVFPRNQTNQKYLYACSKKHIKAYRGNEKSWIYRAFNKGSNTPIKRILRLGDAYLNLTGHHIYPLREMETKPIINVPSSRFLRPYSRSLKGLEGLRLKRIKNSLTKAAKENCLYHLWWHPHNFGKDIEDNLLFLEEIFKHVEYLKSEYNFQSFHMRDVTEIVEKAISEGK